MQLRRWWLIAGLGILLAVAAWPSMEDDAPRLPPLGSPGGLTTSRADLERAVVQATAALRQRPSDVSAAVLLSDAVLRQTRVENDPRLAGSAEQALRRVLSVESDSYDARRMLATVLLSPHRFREAISEATRARVLRPEDEWNDGVIGDAHLELGEYEQAFAAFDRMMARRPSAAAYARVSYARELQGDLDGAILLMTMAREATSPHDPEAEAWHDAQLGHLYIEQGRPREARRYFERAAFAFPEHPFAVERLARLKDLKMQISNFKSKLSNLLASQLAV